MVYSPDVWVILKISRQEAEPEYRVLGGWYGGFLNGDSWRINSGIVRVEREEDYYAFFGASGSCYRCHKGAYRMSSMTASAFAMLSKATPGMSVLEESAARLELLVDVDASAGKDAP